MLGLACNRIQSEEQFCELSAEMAGNRDNNFMSECGDTAITKVNDGADVIMLQCLLEDSRISGFAA